MLSQSEQKQSLTDGELIQLAVVFILGMLRSANSKVIDPRKWWERAKTALETAASRGDTWPKMVSTCGKKLQIEAPTSATTKAICSVQEKIPDSETFKRFRRLCLRDALYVIAMARIEREEQIEEKAKIEKMSNAVKAAAKKGAAT